MPKVAKFTINVTLEQGLFSNTRDVRNLLFIVHELQRELKLCMTSFIYPAILETIIVLPFKIGINPYGK